MKIKPYVPKFDHWDAERTGWLAPVGERVEGARADDRFGVQEA